MRWPFHLLLAVSLITRAGHAQVLRGVVTDSATGIPLAGVLVALQGAPAVGGPAPRSSLALSVLTGADGEYAIRAASPGRYVISLRQIGLRRHQSPPLELRAGETVRYDARMSRAPVGLTLPSINVVTATPCGRGQRDASRIAALWDAASTVIASEAVAAREAMFEGAAHTYVRELAVGSLELLREEWTTHQSAGRSRFTSVDPDRLSAEGFVVEVDGESLIAYAPDAAALMSDAFLRDHCFSLAEPDPTGALVGLAFEPVAGRKAPEVRGVLWLDSRTSELRRLSYSYVNIPRIDREPEARGEVHYTRLDNGAWAVPRWFIRMPEFLAGALGPGSVSRYHEEGGELAIEVPAERLTLRGQVLDSLGRQPLVGAMVRVSGSLLRAEVDSLGRFVLDSVRAGLQRVVVEHPAYGELGLFAAQQVVASVGPDTPPLRLLALTGRGIAERSCGPAGISRGRTAVRVLVRDEVTGLPAPGMFVRALWYPQGGPGRDTQVLTPAMAEGITDRDGTLTLCQLPGRFSVRFEARRTFEGDAVHQVVYLQNSTVTLVELRR